MVGHKNSLTKWRTIKYTGDTDRVMVEVLWAYVNKRQAGMWAINTSPKESDDLREVYWAGSAECIKECDLVMRHWLIEELSLWVIKFACSKEVEGFASVSVATGRASLVGKASTKEPDKVWTTTAHLVWPIIPPHPYPSQTPSVSS